MCNSMKGRQRSIWNARVSQMSRILTVTAQPIREVSPWSSLRLENFRSQQPGGDTGTQRAQGPKWLPSSFVQMTTSSGWRVFTFAS